MGRLDEDMSTENSVFLQDVALKTLLSPPEPATFERCRSQRSSSGVTHDLIPLRNPYTQSLQEKKKKSVKYIILKKFR